MLSIVLRCGLLFGLAWPATDAMTTPAPAARRSEPVPDARAHKPRIFVLTDIGNDPDDRMSLVRLVTYSNQIDIEGMVATGNSRGVYPEYLHQIVQAYGKVRDNLELHEPGYPSQAHLEQRIWSGPARDAIEQLGKAHASAGSQALIREVDRLDPRPLWVSVWGGPGVLAQALWTVRQTRSKRELAAFVAKLRVYAISDQDDTGPWIRNQFPELHYIVSPGVSFHDSTWIGISGDTFHGRFSGPDPAWVSNEWLRRHIRSKGPLGAAYPAWEFQMEGDTPAFLNLVDNGLSDPDHPEWGGWGGRYELYQPRTEKWFYAPETRPIWTNVQDEVLGHDGAWHTSNHATVWRWREAMQNDFAARMDWTIKPYAQANHPPVPKLDHPAHITARAGERVDLGATASSDPDGDALSYAWFVYQEAGTRGMMSSDSGERHQIHDADQARAWLTVKGNRLMPARYGSMHVILAVTDHGTPRLTRYRRVIIDVVP
ncbi:nucleoside hydrolase-like domain-containing protein [Xanthomonas campestris]|uniref:nucleoside hydrolase-like domain-containing protein n=1 Tax=Xanthomonas campestris TaxID=339 RepID=UPI001E58198F|nr:nucleoside hydrolase-like domain-containing protein [Xanthomonas campestris]MCC4605601.1 DUF1593 domain-containing protein [Xanthomonas campestris pv. parthenii]